MRPLIPSLEHAHLVVMRVDMMLFRDIERDKSGQGTSKNGRSGSSDISQAARPGLFRPAATAHSCGSVS
jgi:hypothetical protein